jgi:hypothetical protein
MSHYSDKLINMKEKLIKHVKMEVDNINHQCASVDKNKQDFLDSLSFSILEATEGRTNMQKTPSQHTQVHIHNIRSYALIRTHISPHSYTHSRTRTLSHSHYISPCLQIASQDFDLDIVICATSAQNGTLVHRVR